MDDFYLLEGKCFNHHDKVSNFFCFDEKVLLCDSCFKDHRKHNIEVKSELKKNEKLYKTLTKKTSITENLKSMKNKLINIKSDIEKKLVKINSLLSSLNGINLSPNKKPIYQLNYSEYESIELYCSIYDSMKDLIKKVNDLTNDNKNENYKYFYEINKEVDIIEHSKENKTFNLNSMLGKNKEYFSLFEGTKNNYAVFNLNNFYYLKEILISVKQKYKCVLKNFEVYIKNKKEKWEKVDSFCCKDNTYNEEMQSFPIEKETQYVKINFIDTWPHPGESDSMLIKKMSFIVADII
jgi:hypothetical protein